MMNTKRLAAPYECCAPIAPNDEHRMTWCSIQMLCINSGEGQEVAGWIGGSPRESVATCIQHRVIGWVVDGRIDAKESVQPEAVAS
jgi:hypothetical protein